MSLPKTFDGHSLGDLIVDDNGISKIIRVDPDYSGYTSELIMKIQAIDCREMTNKAIDSINEAIKIAKEHDPTPEQVNALNTGNIVQILGAIANSLAVIADNLEKRSND